MQVSTSGIKNISKLGGMVEGCSKPPPMVGLRVPFKICT